MHVRHEQWARVVKAVCVSAVVAVVAAACVPIDQSTGSGASAALAPGTGTPGALPIGKATYPVPSTGAYFVSPAGNDAAAGTLAAPWKTLRKAVTTAPSGSTVVMRAGVYSESVDVSGKRLTIQPYPSEAVYLRGAKRITAGTPTVVGSRTVWAVRWPYQFPRQRPEILDAQHPLANAPDQLFVNRKPLQQVANLAAVTNQSFYVDYPTSTLYSGVNPASTLVEGSYLQVALQFVNAAGSVLRGIQIEMYATPLSSFAQLRVYSPNVTIENVISASGAASGITVGAAGVVLRHDTFTRNGQLGIHAFNAANLVLDSVRVSLNNAEHFDVTLEGAGVKISSSLGSIVQDSVFDSNAGNGLWFDLDAGNATIVRNTIRNNSTIGLLFELSSNAVIAQNWAWGNLSAGIVTTESDNVDIWNNTAADNGYDIMLMEWIRPQTLRDVRIRNNVTYSSGLPLQLLLVNDYNRQTTAAQMNVTADGDAYCRVYPAFPTKMIGWAAGPTTAMYTSVASFNAATGAEANGVTCDGTNADAWFVNSPNRNWRVKRNTPLANGGVPLAANVAAALGLPAGASIGIGAG